MYAKEILQEYGLTEKESDVYLILLQLGTVSVQHITKRVSLPRTTVFNTLTYLSQKGLVSKIIKERTTFFTATSPEKLTAQLDEKKKLIQSILPELEQLQHTIKESSSMEIYEGFKGIYTIISDVFKEKQEVYYFGGYKKSLQILQHLPEHARMMRLEKNIHARIVIEPSDEKIFHTSKYKRLTDMRFLQCIEDFPCMVFIYGTKTALFTLNGDLIGIIIKNKEITQAMKLIFDLYWKQAKSAKL